MAWEKSKTNRRIKQSDPIPENDNKCKVNDGNDLVIYQCNIRGYKSKSSSIKIISKEIQPDVLVLSETMLTGQEKPRIKNFSPFFRSRSDKGGGGLVTAVADNIAVSSLQTYSGKYEILEVRLEHTATPLTIISVYGVQDTKKELVKEEFEEIVGRMAVAKSRGDLVVVTGDLNRKVGDLITNNDNKVSYGGELWRELLDQENFHLVNSLDPLCKGGPFTWFQPGGLSKSALSLWIVCSEALKHIDTLTIDKDKKKTPFRVTGPRQNRKKTYSDHCATILTLKDLNREIPQKKTIAWSTKKKGAWNKYTKNSEDAGKVINEKLDNIDDVDEAEKVISKEVKNVWWKTFKKVKIKSGGKKKNKEVTEDKMEEAAKISVKKFRDEVEKIKNEGARMGKIYQLRNIVHGKEKQQKQTPSAVKDSKTGEIKYSKAEIKNATIDHVKETLRDREPKEEHEELVNERKRVIAEAMELEPEKRIKFSWGEMENVIKEMKKKSKECHKPVTRAGAAFQTTLLRMSNLCTEKEKIPEKFTETTLTQLKKPKLGMDDLNGYRFIHTKTFAPRTLESLLTQKLKPAILNNVSPYQLGGIRGTRPSEHLYTMKIAMNIYQSVKMPIWMSYFDMSKYFDVQRWDDATCTLVENGVTGPLLRAYSAVTSRNKLRVASPVGMTEWFDTGPLTPQGSSYGALLSAINLDFALQATMALMLAHTAVLATICWRPLVFQDDIAKISTSRQECQIAQTIISETIESKQLKLNVEKCKLLVVGRGVAADRARAETDTFPIMMNQQKICRVAGEKYLGDWIADKGTSESADNTIQQRLKMIKATTCEILALAADLKSKYIGPAATALELWESLIISKLLNNAPTWVQLSAKSVATLEFTQNSFLKRLLGLPRTAPTAGVLWETGCLSMAWRVRLEKLKFAQHLEWRSSEALAVKTWEMESEFNVKGLKHEVELICEKYKLPRPSKSVPKILYNKMIKNAVVEEARLELQEKLRDSSKLNHLCGWTTARANYITMTSLHRIRFLARCRLGCLLEFQGDFGGAEPCECGNSNTLKHVRQGCPLYQDLLPPDMEVLESVEPCEEFYLSVCKRRLEIMERAAQQLSPDPDQGIASLTAD